MITAPSYQGKTIGVFGLARTGVAAVHSLVASGARVWAWDDKPESCVAVGAVAHDLYEADFSELDALMLAPGVPLEFPEPHKLVRKALAAHIPLISDIDIFQSARKTLANHTVVAITGTNGKSTTTALIGHIVDMLRLPCVIGGNIGTGVLALNPLPEKGVYVLELSSFQLDLTQSFKADIAILLNVTPDHLDRHGSFENYVDAKAKLFGMQKTKKGVAIIGVDDESGAKLAATLDQLVIPVSVKRYIKGGVYVLDGILYDDTKGDQLVVGNLKDAKALQGSHNWQNAAAAYAAIKHMGFAPDKILSALSSFPGLVHRQEIIATLKGVRFVNDSKATNSDAAMRALTAFKNIRWIAGGKAKETSFVHLKPMMGSVKKAYFNGAAASLFQQDLGGSVPHEVYETMADAFHAAAHDAVEGDTVLLSPACTAFDQFKDFEHRGGVFREMVQTLEGAVK
ncbi:UDP-N-acetylmuramoyl-L-alanine--D-glutamate ligase [Kordiimonas pumila]|uniref:UDP-N-acetylmuramoylalanine--D-glutamate ligase n=1 Tax=Kordiimonas pumila TaxID=2161677 RepID=A0ABV7D737_9PROT|nr:UDP-N-acetylmuramoyl-L-alanine--D-glutamate ligase [Kordiimonas pumila]